MYLEAQKMVLDLLELELKVVVSHLPRVLGPELLSFETATQALNAAQSLFSSYDVHFKLLQQY